MDVVIFSLDFSRKNKGDDGTEQGFFLTYIYNHSFGENSL